MSLLIAGSIALDDLKTPFGERKRVLGGSAVHASVSASFYCPARILGIAGEDFPKEHIDFLSERNIDVSGLEISKGATFHWEGFYEYDMNQANTLKTDLNVLMNFNPILSPEYKESKYIFLANLDPEIQINILKQINSPKLVVLDTMNFWIENKKEALCEAIKKIDVILLNDMEARQFCRMPNLIAAAKNILKLGVKYVIIKKGEHGALLFSKDFIFSAPSYPQENLVDPTGAGDTFAGGFIGYLAKNNDLSEQNIKQAVIIGSVMASFNVENFSLERMKTLKKKEIYHRFMEIHKCSNFEAIGEHHV